MKGKTGLIVTSGVVAASAITGCGGIETKLASTGDAASFMAAASAADVKAAEVTNPVADAKKLLEDYTADYDKLVKADLEVGRSDLVPLLGHFQRARALLANDSVKKSKEAVNLIGQVAKSLDALKKHYEAEGDNGYLKLFVDAEQRSNGRRANFGGTNAKGGYVVELPNGLESVWYAVAASTASPENATSSDLENIAGKIRLGQSKAKPKGVAEDVYKGAKEYVAKTDVQSAMAWANEVVKELKAEAVKEVVLAGRDVETRDKVSAQVSYANLRALVHMYSVNHRMKSSVDRLSPASNGIFRVCDDGCNVQYVVGGDSMKLTAEQADAFHPSKYAVAPEPVKEAAPAKAAEPVKAAAPAKTK